MSANGPRSDWQGCTSRAIAPLHHVDGGVFAVTLAIALSIVRTYNDIVIRVTYIYNYVGW